MQEVCIRHKDLYWTATRWCLSSPPAHTPASFVFWWELTFHGKSSPGKTVGPKEPQGRFYWFSLTRLPARKCGSRSQWLSAKWNACVSIWWEQRLRTYPPQHALGPDTVGATTEDLSAPACTGTWLRVHCSHPACWRWIHSWFLALGVSGWPSFRRRETLFMWNHLCITHRLSK